MRLKWWNFGWMTAGIRGLLRAVGRGFDRASEDAAERVGERRQRVVGGRDLPPGDVAVRAHEDRAVALDPAMARPEQARVEEVALAVADAHRVERQAGLGRQLARGVAPVRAVLARDQQEATGVTRSLIGRRLPLSSIQACGSGAPGRVDGS